MLTSYILQKYNLEQAFYLLALLNVVASFMCCSYRPVYKASKSKISSRIKESFGFDVLKEKKFLIWCAATFVAILGYLIPIVIIVSIRKYFKSFLIIDGDLRISNMSDC